MRQLLISFLIILSFTSTAQNNSQYVKEHYTKIDTTIIMRDGIKLFTVIYVPKDISKDMPFLMERTPYSAAP